MLKKGVHFVMALINCPECGRPGVSNQAIACPGCGFGVKEFYKNNQSKNNDDNNDNETFVSEYSTRDFFDIDDEINELQTKMDDMALREAAENYYHNRSFYDLFLSDFFSVEEIKKCKNPGLDLYEKCDTIISFFDRWAKIFGKSSSIDSEYDLLIERAFNILADQKYVGEYGGCTEMHILKSVQAEMVSSNTLFSILCSDFIWSYTGGPKQNDGRISTAGEIDVFYPYLNNQDKQECMRLFGRVYTPERVFKSKEMYNEWLSCKQNNIDFNEVVSKRVLSKDSSSDTSVKCPRCGSTQITTGARGVNNFWGFWGASKTVNRCAKCGNTWTPKG